MSAPINRTSMFFCIPFRKKRKTPIKESALKPTETALQAIKARSEPIDVPGAKDRPPSIKITLVPGFGEVDTDRLSSVHSAASSLQRTSPVDNHGTNDLRDGFYWKQNDDGTWSILPK